MKNLNLFKKLLILTVISSIATQYTAQAQMTKWYIPNRVVTVSGANPSDASLGSSDDADIVANGFYDNSSNLLFYISDGEVYNSSHTNIGQITFGFADTRTSEIVVVPFNCEFKKIPRFSLRIRGAQYC